MALLQKKQISTSSTPLYLLNQDNTLLLVGLGNPGKKYDKTRHNIGFMCLDDFVQKHEFGGWRDSKNLKCLITTGVIQNFKIIAVKPNTFMNNSGESIGAAQAYFKINNKQTVVIHDELDVPFGQLRTRKGGGAAGHNGVKSLIQHVGEDFGRIRVGIGPKSPPEIDSADYVLKKFSKDEQKYFQDLTREVSVIVDELLFATTFPHETRSFLI